MNTKINIEVIYTKSDIEVLCNKLKMGIDSTEFHSYMLLGKIFDPLYQVNNSHRGGEHSGLGLAIVRRILELHGSDIHVASTPGQGTSFSFSLKIPA